MREEDGIRYYDEGEKVMTLSEWYAVQTCTVNALAYELEPSLEVVSILAEAVTERDNDKLEQLADKYDAERLIIIQGFYVQGDCALLL